MRKLILLIAIAVCLAAGNAIAADKDPSMNRIEAARSAVDSLAAKVGTDKAGADELQAARASLKKAEEVYEKAHDWRSIMSLGEKKTDTEQEILHQTGLVDLNVAIAGSRIAKASMDLELEAMNKKTASIQAKIKAFEDRKAELDKLKAEAAKAEALSKENASLKAENKRLSEQIEKLAAERKATEAPAPVKEPVTITPAPAAVQPSREVVPQPEKSVSPAPETK